MQQEQNAPSIFDEIQQQNPVTYATVGQRFANFVVDSILFYIITQIVNYAVIFLVPGFLDGIRENIGQVSQYTVILMAISLSCHVLLYTLFEGVTNGKTLGKLITKTRVIREDGQPLTLKDAFLRTLCRFVPFEPFSTFSGYPWHDKWTKTIVVKDDGIRF